MSRADFILIRHRIGLRALRCDIIHKYLLV